jgi:hypothetical protein
MAVGKELFPTQDRVDLLGHLGPDAVEMPHASA